MIFNHTEIDTWGEQSLPILKKDGIVRLPWVWPEHEIKSHTDYLQSRPVYPGHVWNKGDGKPRQWSDAQQIEVLSYRTEDTITAPYFFEWAVQFTDFVRGYLGVPPRMYSCNAFWARPGPSDPHVDIQQWHRDRDDLKFLALFYYGTDVLTEEQGPHLYAKGSHNVADTGNVVPTKNIETIYAPAGSAFFADAFGLHHGLKPKVGTRLLAWARWGVSPAPRAYGWDKTQPVPASKTPSLQTRPDILESTSLVVDWDK
jgi:hypothetical protein